MLQLPKTTEGGIRVPKEKLYAKCKLTMSQKRNIIDDILNIEWKNKLSCDTINILAGKTFIEIEVFAVTLKSGRITDSHLQPIDESIPYPVLHLAKYDGKVQAWIAYKEKSKDEQLKTVCFFHTEWQSEEDFTLDVQGLTLDEVYERLIWQIADTSEWKAELTVRANIDRQAQRDKLKKRIAALESRMRREKQFNLKVEMNAEIKRMKEELEEM